jgi:HSP20 family molecular chaperone IbpA
LQKGKMSVVDSFDPVAAHLDDHFGLGYHPDDLARTQDFLQHERSVLPTGYKRSWALIPRRRTLDEVNMDKSMHTATKDGHFQVCIDVHQFSPKEIHVRTLGNLIIVEADHEERSEGSGFIERHFVRKYTLPEQYDTEHILSTLSSDGVLTVKSPPLLSAIDGHRTLPIHQTGPAHLSIMDHVVFVKGTNDGEKKD